MSPALIFTVSRYSYRSIIIPSYHVCNATFYGMVESEKNNYMITKCLNRYVACPCLSGVYEGESREARGENLRVLMFSSLSISVDMQKAIADLAGCE